MLPAEWLCPGLWYSVLIHQTLLSEKQDTFAWLHRACDKLKHDAAPYFCMLCACLHLRDVVTVCFSLPVFQLCVIVDYVYLWRNLCLCLSPNFGFTLLLYRSLTRCRPSIMIVFKFFCSSLLRLPVISGCFCKHSSKRFSCPERLCEDLRLLQIKYCAFPVRRNMQSVTQAGIFNMAVVPLQCLNTWSGPTSENIWYVYISHSCSGVQLSENESPTWPAKGEPAKRKLMRAKLYARTNFLPGVNWECRWWLHQVFQHSYSRTRNARSVCSEIERRRLRKTESHKVW